MKYQDSIEKAFWSRAIKFPVVKININKLFIKIKTLWMEKFFHKKQKTL